MTEAEKGTDPKDPQEEGAQDIKLALEAAQKKAEESWERLLRKEAEHQNTVRRLTQDVENMKKFGIERFAGDLLAVVDSLERGLSALPENKESSFVSLKEGMDLTLKQLLQVLEKFGVTSFNPQGEVFDPTLHAALSLQETEDFPPNHVTVVVQKGYLLQGRLLRAASVIVSKSKESVAPGA